MKWPWTVEKPREDIEARLERLEREWKNTVIEWEEWYDKFRHLYARIAKRVQREEIAASTADGRSPNGSSDNVPPAGGGVTSHLSDRAARINDEILKRRGRGNGV